MTFGRIQDGSCVLTFTPQEGDDLKAGKPIVKHSGDSQGNFQITAQLTRFQTPSLAHLGQGLLILAHYPLTRRVDKSDGIVFQLGTSVSEEHAHRLRALGFVAHDRSCWVLPFSP